MTCLTSQISLLAPAICDIMDRGPGYRVSKGQGKIPGMFLPITPPPADVVTGGVNSK